MNLIGPINSGAATGGAGAAGANADTTTTVTGLLVAVYVKYIDSPPAGTTDVVVKTKGTDPSAPSLTLLSITDAATDGWFYPRANIHNTSGTAQTSTWTLLPVYDMINVAIAQANNNDNIDVWLLVE